MILPWYQDRWVKAPIPVMSPPAQMPRSSDQGPVVDLDPALLGGGDPGGGEVDPVELGTAPDRDEQPLTGQGLAILECEW